MGATIIAALIAALAGVGSAIATSVSNRNSVRDTNATNASNVAQTNATNIRLAGEANQWQTEEWTRQFNLQNEYNLPSNQMQRYRDANINPALAMGGNLVDATASSPSTPSANLASATPFQAIAPMLSNMFSTSDANSLADAALKRAQAENLDAQTDEIQTMLPERVNRNRAEIEEIRQAIDNMQQQIEESKAKVSLLDEQTQKTVAERLHVRFLEDLYSKEYGLKLKQFKETVRMNNKLVEQINSQIALNASQADYNRALKNLSERSLLELEKTWNYRLLGIQNSAWSSSQVTQEKILQNALLGYDLKKAEWLWRTSPVSTNGGTIEDMISFGVHTLEMYLSPVNVILGGKIQ